MLYDTIGAIATKPIRTQKKHITIMDIEGPNLRDGRGIYIAKTTSNQMAIRMV